MTIEELHRFLADEEMEVSEHQVCRFREALVDDGLDVPSLRRCQYNVWLNMDESAPTTATLSDAEIVSAITEIGDPGRV